MPIDVTARHAFAYSGGHLQLADEHTMTFVSGNALAFTSTVSNSQHFLLRAKPRQLVAFDCNWRTTTVAVTAREPSPDILLYSYPDKKLRGKLQHGARFEYSKIGFSRCGRRLVSLRPMDADESDESSSVAATTGPGTQKPRLVAAASSNDNTSGANTEGSTAAARLAAKRQRLCVWDVEQLEPVKGCANGVVTIDAAFVAFDPANADQFVVGGDDGLQIWKIYRGKGSSLLRHVSVHLGSSAAASSTFGRVGSLSIRNEDEDPSDTELLDLEEKRSQWLCHAWVKNEKLLAANRAGELVLVDAASATIVQIIEPAVLPNRCCISAIVYTAESVVVAYVDGRVLWLNEKNWEVMQSASLPMGAANTTQSGSEASIPIASSGDASLVACMAPSPNHSKLYVGTRDGRIFELKSSVLVDEEEDEDGNAGAMATSPGNINSNDSHLVVPCGSFPVGTVLACSALTPSGGTFLNDAVVASGGVSGRLYLWSITKCRLVVDASVSLLFAHAPSSSSDGGGFNGGIANQSTGSLSQISNSQSGESLGAAPSSHIDSEAAPVVIITALASKPADPVLILGDQSGRLRTLCASKIVGGSGAVELLPLHSLQLVADAPLDILEMHPTQTVVLAASTRANHVFLLSTDHEKHFPVLAFFPLLEPKEHVVDVQWSLPAHNASALIVTCFSSRGLFYVARYQQTNGNDPSMASSAPLQLKTRVVAFGEEMLPKCASLRFLRNAPMSMMLATAPDGNSVHVMKYMEMVLDPTEKINILSKVLAQDAHENGIAAMALYPRVLADGSELVATAGMNGAITIWLVAFGASGSGSSGGTEATGASQPVAQASSRAVGKEWQLEDIQAAKKKTIVVHSGPVTSLLFLNIGDDLYLVSTGSDGCVFLLDVRIPPETKAPSGSDSLAIEHELNMNPLYLNLTTFAKYDETFKPAQELEIKPFLRVLKENDEFAARNRFDRLKDQTRAQLNDVELKLKLLLAENNKLPEGERLARDEFVINVDWRDQLLKKNKKRAERVREGILKDLAKMNIVRERMKHEFWDSATVQGVRLRGLSPSASGSGNAQHQQQNSGLFVYNFPMRRQTKQEVLTARKIELMRTIEFAHQQQEAIEAADTVLQTDTALSRFSQVLAPSNNLQWLIDAGIHHPSLNKWLAEKAKSSLGSPSMRSYGELLPYQLVYHPAAIRTRKQQRIQIHLLKLFVRALVVEFNDEFNALVRLKEAKVEEIEAKNARILEIGAELGVPSSVTAQELYRPQLAPDEIAASILEVKPEEMTQKMYETEEMRRKREKEAQEKAELERQRQKDDVAGRALTDMMDGTLEVKKENLATQSFVKEQWMIDTPVDEMTVEQKKLVAQFELAQQKFLEEKEKYKKSLDLELKKIRGEIGDVCKAFDDKLRGLQESYLHMRRSVLVQHLYELRLAGDLMDHEQLLLGRQRVEGAIMELESEIKKSERENELFAVQLDGSKDEWHRAVDEDKSCEKNFLKELEELTGSSTNAVGTGAGVGAVGAGAPLEHDLVKHLVELYKKRKGDDLMRDSGDAMARKGGAAKRGKSSQHLGMGTSSLQLSTGTSAKARLLAEGLSSDPSSRSLSPVTLLQSLQHSNSDGVEGDANVDPFQYLDYQQQPQLKRLNSGGINASQRHVVPLDYDVDRPDGVLIEDRVWRALNALRTKKILAEHTAKEKAEQYALAKSVAEELRSKLTEFQYSLQEQISAYEASTRQLEALVDNSPLLVHIKQGQDESSSSSSGSDDLLRYAAPADALLVARASVESLNDVIQLHGKDQVGILSKIKNFRKNINVMEWEHTLLQMQTRDMEERYTDIQLLRVTKDLQELFHTGDTSEKQKREIALLEAKMVHLGKNHQTNLIKLDQTMAKLQKQWRERVRENQGFEQQAQQLQMQVQIREDILSSRKSAALRNAAPSSSSTGGGESAESPQLKAIVVRRKLVDLAKSQTEEIEYLRMELDKMRRRTFPSFVQHQAAREYHASDSK
ncbi:hypothetical protein Gpo141_00004180 [Globisporangium polare]